MNAHITRQASAIVCAAIATLAMLAGTDLLATQMTSSEPYATRSSTPPTTAMQVVVVGQRAARS